MKFNKMIPELSVSNIEKSIKFYLSLGFKIKYKREEDKLYFIEMEHSQFMIQEINNVWKNGKLEYPFGRGINFSIEVSNIKSLYEKVKKYKYDIFFELNDNQYKVGNRLFIDKEFIILDPDGYMLRFNQEVL